MVAMAEEVKAWLSSFESALLQRDVEAATQLFLPEECFWRDLLAFTWNIYTAESQQEIGDMLRSTLVDTDHIYPASSWKLQGEATEAEAEAEEAEEDSLLNLDSVASSSRSEEKEEQITCSLTLKKAS